MLLRLFDLVRRDCALSAQRASLAEHFEEVFMAGAVKSEFAIKLLAYSR